MMEKGSIKALVAGKRAAETRKRNLLLKTIGVDRIKHKNAANFIIRKSDGTTSTFAKLDESNYHKIDTDSPVTIWIHKDLNNICITTIKKNA